MSNKKHIKLNTYARHKHLVERYKYWADVQRRKEEDVIAILAYKECFFDPNVIYIILRTFEPNAELDAQLKEKLKFVDKAKNNQSQTSLF